MTAAAVGRHPTTVSGAVRRPPAMDRRLDAARRHVVARLPVADRRPAGAVRPAPEALPDGVRTPSE